MTRTISTQAAPATSRAAALDRSVAIRLAATEYDRFADQLRRLGPNDWQRGTDCPEWDVKAMAGHVLGMAEMVASVPEQIRQTRAAAKAGGDVDALTAHQVAKHATTTPAELVRRFAQVGPKAAKGRRRVPGFIRRRNFSPDQAVNGVDETWTLGFLVDVILTRDTWMHRIDIARAVGQDPELTPDHDGVLVADVVAEWAGRHQRPCRLTLTGPAGGQWTFGAGGPELEEDAVQFCRLLSGRGSAPGLIATAVPF